MIIDNNLKQELVKLHNKIFRDTIDMNEKDISAAVMLNITCMYVEGGSPLDGALAAEKAVSKIKDENERLLICKQLLNAEIVKIPGMHGDYRLWGLFYDMSTGAKLNPKFL